MGVRDVSSNFLVLVVAVTIVVDAVLVLVAVVTTIALESGPPIGKIRGIIAIQTIVTQYLLV